MADVALLQSVGFFDVVEPVFNPETHKLGSIFFDTANLVFTYPVINKTQSEIDYDAAMAGWHHPEYSKRIIAPSALLYDYPAIGVHMWINKLPIEPSADGSTLYLYMNVIRPEHQALVNNLEEILTIENKPLE